MSYCRFENTYRDLVDCENQLNANSIDCLSETEKKYAIRLIALCKEISENFDEEDEDEN